MVINKDKTKTPPPPLLPRLIFTPSLPTPLHLSPEQVRGMGNGSYDQSVMHCLCCSFFLMFILCSSVGSAWASVLQVMSTSSNVVLHGCSVDISSTMVVHELSGEQPTSPWSSPWAVRTLAPPSLSSLTLFVAGLFLTIFLTAGQGFWPFLKYIFPEETPASLMC